jgi:hypothetical protein
MATSCSLRSFDGSAVEFRETVCAEEIPPAGDRRSSLLRPDMLSAKRRARSTDVQSPGAMPGAMPTAPERAGDRTILVRSFEILSVFDWMSQTRGFGSRCSINTAFGTAF